MRKLKCYGDDCYNNNLTYNKDELTKFHGKNYCKKCYDKITKDNNEREELIHFLYNQFGEYPSGRILKQMKDYRIIRNYSYHDQLLALKYFIEEERGELRNTTIGIIPYVIYRAKEFEKEKDSKKVLRMKKEFSKKEEYKVKVKKENKKNIEEKVKFDFDIEDEKFEENNF